MIENISISRFKSIKDISLDLGRVNMFIGGNGAGKSNILEAIGIASASIYRGLGDTDLSAKGIRLTPAELMKSAFKQDRLAQTFEICVSFLNSVKYKCNLNSKENDALIRFHSESCFIGNEKQFGRSGNGSTVHGRSIFGDLDKDRGMWDQIRTAHEFPKILIDQFDEFSKYKIFTPQTDVLRGVRSGYLDASPFGLHGEGLGNALSGVFSLRQNYRSGSNKNEAAFNYIEDSLKLSFLPGWNNTVRVGKIDSKLVSRGIQDKASEMVYFVDKFMKINRNTLSLYDSSEGTLFLLFIAILLSHKDSPRYFALDNVDNALNPVMTMRLLESLIAQIDKVYEHNLTFGPRQMFLTSHNPTSLDAFDIFDDQQRVFVVRRAEDGATVAKRLAPPPGMSKDEWRIASKGRNLSQLWLDGLIEGVNGRGI